MFSVYQYFYVHLQQSPELTVIDSSSFHVPPPNQKVLEQTRRENSQLLNATKTYTKVISTLCEINLVPSLIYQTHIIFHNLVQIFRNSNPKSFFLHTHTLTQTHTRLRWPDSFSGWKPTHVIQTSLLTKPTMLKEIISDQRIIWCKWKPYFTLN